jgi:hypothetical protein
MAKCIAIFASIAATAALAQGEAPPFDRVDANGDGVINRAEAAAVANLDFAGCDNDGDGYLSRQEYVACMSSG